MGHYTSKNGKQTVRLVEQDGDHVVFRTADGATHKAASASDFFGEFVEATAEEAEAFDAEANVDEAAAALRPATDDELRTIITDFSGERTQAGAPEMAALNDEIVGKGFLPINAAKRDELIAG